MVFLWIAVTAFLLVCCNEEIRPERPFGCLYLNENLIAGLLVIREDVIAEAVIILRYPLDFLGKVFSAGFNKFVFFAAENPFFSGLSKFGLLFLDFLVIWLVCFCTGD